jgi:6-phospho-3-hexuloisomerase
MVVTAQPAGAVPQRADVIIHLPAQTMADDLGAAAGLLPMGSLYEAAQLVFFDLVSILLRERTGQAPEQMRARHTNLE